MSLTPIQIVDYGVLNSTTGKKVIILFCSLLFLNLYYAFAQSDFRPGYVLISEFDTIFGEIDNQDYHMNSNFCDFRAFNSNEITRYYPKDIHGYRFLDGKYYISRETPVPDGSVKKVFLEYLIKGELNIYFYQDTEKNNIYYAEKDTSALVELVYYKTNINYTDQRFTEAEKRYQGSVMNYNTSGFYEYENKKFQGILAYLTYDEPRLKQQIQNIKEPSHNELIKLAKNYHELTCPDEDCTVFEKRKRNPIKLSISAGNFMITRTSLLEEDPNKVIPKNSPSLALNVYFSQLERSERLFLGIGIRHEFMNIQYSEEVERANTTRIPLSANYFHSKQGLSPMISYAFDLRSFAYVQTIMLGLNYRFDKFSIYLAADIDTYAVTKIFATSQRIGISYDFNQPKF